MVDSEREVHVQRIKHYRERYTGRDRRGIAELYNEWSQEDYEQDIEAMDHRGRYVVTENLIQEYKGDRETANVLDVAAGTGMLATQLFKPGFLKIDALDGSAGMLEVAKQKQLYQNYICSFMEEVDAVIKDGTYDIVCSLGAIGSGHLEAEALRQMIRITRPGGLVCISGVKERWDANPEYNVRMRKLITELHDGGKVAIVRDTVIKEYYLFYEWHEGVLILLLKL